MSITDEDYSGISPFTDTELNQIMSGRASLDDIIQRRAAEAEKASKKAASLHMHGDVDASALTDRMIALERRLTTLEALLAVQPILEGGKLPPKADITQLWCQVFHSPNLTPKERKTKGEWSLRLTIWINNKKVKREINVRLFPTDQFYRQAMNRPQVPKALDDWATVLRNETGMMAGMLVATTQGQGRPFIASQFCVLEDHLTDSPKVDLLIDGDLIIFEGARPSKGTSKWFFDWRP